MTDNPLGGNGGGAAGPTSPVPPAGAAAGANPAQMPLVVNAQYIKDMSFELPNAPQILRRLTEQPQVQVNVNVQAQQLGGDVYEVTLTLNAEAKLGQDALFIVELIYAGIFTVQGVPQDILRPLLLIECPRLLFPFARSIIAGLTREGGLPPMMIQPIDFADLYRRQLQAGQPPAPIGTA
ncbi:MAG: protein-export chaperone SecB [Alphaproteobacteria bacterium]|nr:protein-export chaperone SecB [Alphaproteobacteria bacterium]